MRVDKNKALKIDSFIKNRDIYYLLYYIIRTDGSILYSDLDSYIIGRINDEYPVWIWNSDSISDKSIGLLLEDLDSILVSGKNEITCSNMIYNSIKNKYNITDYLDISFLMCKKLIKPKDCGNVKRAVLSDKDNLIELFKNDSIETEGIELSDEEANNEIDYFINIGKLYILENKGKILSMCCYNMLDEMIKLTCVFTPKEYRNNGYCEWLVYNVTSRLLKLGFKVLLYTDRNYLPSNRAYKKIGFKEYSVLSKFNINM